MDYLIRGGGQQRILFLGYEECQISDFLVDAGCYIVQTSDKINKIFILNNKFDFLISYGYRYIIDEEVINLFNGNAINLHISYLPYNRGADPNFWSFVENSKKGVTIHLLDKGLDTGDIIVQKEIKFDKDETLASSYKKLNLEIQNLFIKNWDLIKTKSYTPKKQSGGTYHRSKDKDRYFSLLPDGWDTKISDLKQPYIK
ncbi:formyltransferase family protein [Campylobacter hyointestinalis]|uniref:formyltransferase family protein n=1 Tax=Campylobacter hyointestinalis TaxID=198 RepID=UPI000DCCBE7E|nr:formyltransferase family protein [Campylobacter hyointestinalis]RAZ52059.1 formyl transferase [Campylobacter hyointestinalis subsp. lawsonii]